MKCPNTKGTYNTHHIQFHVKMINIEKKIMDKFGLQLQIERRKNVWHNKHAGYTAYFELMSPKQALNCCPTSILSQKKKKQARWIWWGLRELEVRPRAFPVRGRRLFTRPRNSVARVSNYIRHWLSQSACQLTRAPLPEPQSAPLGHSSRRRQNLSFIN